MKRIFFLTVKIIVFAASVNFAQIPEYYVKKNNWIETLTASREALILVEKEGSANIRIKMGTWYSAGPWVSESGNSFESKFPPEGNDKLNTVYGDKKWEVRPDWKDGVVIDDLPAVKNSASYIQKELISDCDTTITGYFGSDDGIKVWLNGDNILSNDTHRACRPNEDKAELKLIRGNNRLLVKISNNNDDSGFYFSTYENDPKNIIWSMVKKDFPKPDDFFDIFWTGQDNVWKNDPVKGDYSLIAKNYARALKETSPETSTEILNKTAGKVTAKQLEAIHYKYIRAKRKDYVVLTPKPSAEPKINGAKIFGVRPLAPFQYTIAATGKRPVEFSAEDMPDGLTLDKKTGIITGAIANKGEYKVKIKVKNSFGTAERELTIICGNQIALTPPMGWNSWNCFAGSVNAEKIKSAADAMVKSGLINHGWTYINIDDYWEVQPGSSDSTLKGNPRDTEGFIIPNKRFPDMKVLSRYIHNKGLKIGIYSSPGSLTCGGCTGSLGFEEKDAWKYGEWEIDYLKYDWCSYQGDKTSLNGKMQPFNIMRSALNKINRDIVFSLSFGDGRTWEWGDKVGANCWRTTQDIGDSWDDILRIGFTQGGLEKYAKPGNWNDPDMLVVGPVGWHDDVHPTRLSPNEQYSHISLWCLLSAPLLIGCDMTRLDDFTLGLLTNDEVLEVDQDLLGKQAAQILKSGDTEIWAKDLEGGTKAVGLFNKGNVKIKVSIDLKQLGFNCKCTVWDLWRQKNLGKFDSEFKADVAPHGVVLVKITGNK